MRAGFDQIADAGKSAAMTDLHLRKGEQVYIFVWNRSVVKRWQGGRISPQMVSDQSQPFTPLTNTLEMIWSFVIDLSGVTQGRAIRRSKLM